MQYFFQKFFSRKVMLVQSFLVFFLFALVSLCYANVINGAGATFPYPLYLKMIEVYHQENNIQVNYQPIGSGGGIRNILSGILDFAGSDVVMTDEEELQAGIELLHIPTAIGSIALIYNLPGVEGVVLDASLIEKIYTGDISYWDDLLIQQRNPSLKLPHLKIIPVYRSDGSGTTYIFTDYLARVSREWCELYGVDKSISWSVGVGQKGNAGIASYVKNTKGAIGYTEVGYAEQSRLPFVHIENASGFVIRPEDIVEATTEASRLYSLPSSLKVSLVNSPLERAFPISSFTWILIRKEQSYNGRTKEQALATRDFIKWIITQGQSFARPLYYAPLSRLAQEKALALLDTLTYKGEKL